MIAALNNPAILRGVVIDAFALWDINDYNGNLSFTLPTDNASTNANTWQSGFGPSGSVVNGTSVCSSNTPQVGAGVPLSDAGGNSFVIDSNGQVDYNGVPIAYTANVTYLAKVNNAICQFGTGQWYSFGPVDGSGVPTTASGPIANLPCGCSNDMQVGPGVGLSDASGNCFFIDSNGQVE